MAVPSVFNGLYGSQIQSATSESDEEVFSAKKSLFAGFSIIYITYAFRGDRELKKGDLIGAIAR